MLQVRLLLALACLEPACSTAPSMRPTAAICAGLLRGEQQPDPVPCLARWRLPGL